MAFLDTVWSVVNTVDNLLDGGRSRKAAAFELAANQDDSEQAVYRPVNALPSGAGVAPSSATTDSDAPAELLIRPVSEQVAAEAQVTRRAAAIALSYRSFGDVDAAREMRARTRDLS